MYKTLIAIALAAASQAPAAAQTPAPGSADVIAVVNKFVDGFNKGDSKAALATCAEQVSIIDEFPPYEWHGAGSCAKWMSDFEADGKKNGITDAVVTLEKPAHVDIVGDRAYAVFPASFTYKVNGKADKETGSTLTCALQKSGAGWRLIGWAWAKH